MEQTIKLEVPVGYVEDNGCHVMFSNDETKKFLDVPIVVQGESKEDAVRKYWEMVKYHIEFLDRQYHRLQRVAPFTKGPWKHKGGKWFSIFGIHIYFRTGKGMQGGWYIPLTRLNIRVTNYWTLKHRK